MSQTIPKIYIKYARFLDPIFKTYVAADPRWNDVVVPTENDVKERVARYREAWEHTGSCMLQGVCDVLDLSFDRPVIDVYVVSLNPRPFSDPIILKSGYDSHEFPSVLTHELIHRLFTINGNRVYQTIFSDLFPNESPTVQNHVVVHAVLKHVYLDAFHDESLLEAHLVRSKEHTTDDYSRAWNIVDERGYTKVIEEFKKKLR